LREILARSDNDFLFSEPRRSSRSRRSNRPRGKFMRFLQVVQRVAAHPNRIAGAIIATLVVAISVNALEFQQPRHRAPLFHKSLVAPVAAVKAPQKPQFAPITPPAARSDPIDQLLRSTAAERQRAAPPSRQANQDPISQLLKTQAAQSAPQPSKTIIALQRGELSPKVLRELSARSGIHID
jgi:hypothetical protein